MGVSIKIEERPGQTVADVLGASNAIPEAVARRIMGQACYAGAEQLAALMVTTNAFEDLTGHLRSHIFVKWSRHTYIDQNLGRRKVVRRGAARVGAFSPHAHLVELGHAGPAPAPAHPFIVPALEQGGKAAWTAAVKRAKRNLPGALRAARNAAARNKR